MSHLKIAVVAATVLLATTACGGSPEGASATDQTLDQGPREFGGPAGGGFPGASGTIAAVDGKTLQVQNPMEGQVAVTYDKATTFTEQVEVDQSALGVGDCVMVIGEGEDTLAATDVRITPAGDNGCSPGRGGGPGGPQLEGEGPPEGVTVMAMGAFGEVTAVDGSTFTVEMTMPGSDEVTTREVTTSADTSWTDTVETDSKAVRVGRCATALGERGDTGALTATSIAISDAVDGECGMGGVFRSEAMG